MIQPDTEVRFRDNNKGYGLFAARFIACGTITWFFDALDREIQPAELVHYDPLYQESLLKYFPVEFVKCRRRCYTRKRHN